jgi:hypothetical protein
VVGGYCGSVNAWPGRHNKVFLDKKEGSSQRVLARLHRDGEVPQRMILWYDSRGEQVEKP